MFDVWRRYHWVAEDDAGRFSPEERGAAARERDMFRRQLDALGCDPVALLALAEVPTDASAGPDDEEA